MNTPTPRTDEFEALRDAMSTRASADYFAALQLCDELERELTAAREKLAEWNILNGWGGTPEIINDFIKGQQTRIHYAQNLEEELTAVTEQRDRLAEALKMITTFDYADLQCDNGHGARSVATEALQSLN